MLSRRVADNTLDYTRLNTRREERVETDELDFEPIARDKGRPINKTDHQEGSHPTSVYLTVRYSSRYRCQSRNDIRKFVTRVNDRDRWNPDNAYRSTVLKHGWQNDRWETGRSPPTLVMDS